MAWGKTHGWPFSTYLWRKCAAQANYSQEISVVVEVITLMEGVIYLSDDTNASTQKPSDIYMAATHLTAAHIFFFFNMAPNEC